jgi:hypothetical protein
VRHRGSNAGRRSLSQSRTGHVHPQTDFGARYLRTKALFEDLELCHRIYPKHMVDGLGASGDLLRAHRHCSAGFNLVSKRRRSRLLHPVHLCPHVENTANRDKRSCSMKELAHAAHRRAANVEHRVGDLTCTKKQERRFGQSTRRNRK